MEAPLDLTYIQTLFSAVSVVITTISVIVGAVYSYYSIRTKRLTDVNRGIEITPQQITTMSLVEEDDARPFEVVALANYYNQALNRANISFWFSIVFASIGFGVIIFAFLTHSPSDIAGTVVKVASGTVIDAVSGLFFVQSTSAQKSMSDFFEKLRLDRLNAEARDMIDEIENVEKRDQLRSQLILKYSNIDKLLLS